MKRLPQYAAILLFSAALLAACSGGSDTTTARSQAAEPSASAGQVGAGKAYKASHYAAARFAEQATFGPTPALIEELRSNPVRRMLPTVVHPNEILDGAVVRGFMGRGVTTWATQNHPVIRELYARHGQALWFAGVVLTVAHATEPQRVRSAAMAAGLVVDVLGADGAVFTKIGGGAPHVDMAQTAAQCEARGVRTALIVEDMSTDGSEEGMLLFNFPGLNALVNVGSAQEKTTLPPVARVVGADDLGAGGPSNYGGICGAIEQVGSSRVMAHVVRGV